MSIFDSLPPAETSEEFKTQFYAELHKRTRKGMQHKAEDGDMPGCAPVGYLNTWNGEKKSIGTDPVKAPLIKEAFQLAAENQLSLRKILKIVTDKGLTSRNGKRLSVSALWGVLANPFYIRKIRYGNQIFAGSHEPLISKKVFHSVQAKLPHSSNPYTSMKNRIARK